MMENGFWVFGYGSLIWHPDIAYEKRMAASMHGYARRFCMWSIHHRGSVEHPGLVLALDKQDGAQCDGVAFYVPATKAVEALASLRERELVSSAYLEISHAVQLASGEKVEAITYVIDPNHVQYTGDLSLDAQAKIIASATGGRGSNDEYLFKTCESFLAMQIEDADLAYLDRQVRMIKRGAVI